MLEGASILESLAPHLGRTHTGSRRKVTSLGTVLRSNNSLDDSVLSLIGIRWPGRRR